MSTSVAPFTYGERLRLPCVDLHVSKHQSETAVEPLEALKLTSPPCRPSSHRHMNFEDYKTCCFISNDLQEFRMLI